MKRPRLWLALALIVAVNALVLTGVARNRAGAPEASLTLTERELPLDVDPYHDEKSGVALRLDWNQGYGIDQWFDAGKLRELGFDVPSSSGKSEDFHRLLPRKVFVVLEYEGATWLRFKAEKERKLNDLEEKSRAGTITEEDAKNERAWLERVLRFGSRLFAVDAGVDPRQLRQRYPDKRRYPIMAASVRAISNYEESREIPRGTVDHLLITGLHVPHELHAPLLGLPFPEPFHFNRSEPVPRPRYTVQVEWGQRHEPWVTGVSLVGEDSTE